MMTKMCKNHKPRSWSLFSLIIQKPMEKSCWVVWLMQTSRLAYKNMSSLQHFIELCFRIPKINKNCSGRKLTVPFPFFYRFYFYFFLLCRQKRSNMQIAYSKLLFQFHCATECARRNLRVGCFYETPFILMHAQILSNAFKNHHTAVHLFICAIL